MTVQEDAELRDKGYRPQQIGCHMCQNTSSQFYPMLSVNMDKQISYKELCGHYVANAECPGHIPHGKKMLKDIFDKPKYIHYESGGHFCQPCQKSHHSRGLEIAWAKSAEGTICDEPDPSPPKAGWQARARAFYQMVQRDLDPDREFARDELIACELEWKPLTEDHWPGSRICLSFHGIADQVDEHLGILMSPTIKGKRVIELLEIGTTRCDFWPFLAIPLGWPENIAVNEGVLITAETYDELGLFGGSFYGGGWTKEMGRVDGRDCYGVCTDYSA